MNDLCPGRVHPAPATKPYLVVGRGRLIAVALLVLALLALALIAGIWWLHRAPHSLGELLLSGPHSSTGMRIVAAEDVSRWINRWIDRCTAAITGARTRPYRCAPGHARPQEAGSVSQVRPSEGATS